MRPLAVMETWSSPLRICRKFVFKGFSSKFWQNTWQNKQTESSYSTCPSLYHCSTGGGKAWATHSRVRVLFILIFTSLGASPSPRISFLLICGGTSVKNTFGHIYNITASQIFLKRCRYLTMNFNLIVLQHLSRLISSHTCVPPGILLLSIDNLQCSPTCQGKD